MSATGTARSRGGTWLPVLLLAAVAVVGLENVKWQPYVLRCLGAMSGHASGTSIIAGAASHPPAAGLQSGIAYVVTYGRAVWKALLLAIVLGAGVEVLLPRTALARVFAGRGAPARATAAALPSMMCTCCAAPIAVGLIRGRAQTAAALSYWLANPVLNPATLVLVGLLLGWKWAALRLALGVVLVFGLSHLAARLLPGQEPLSLPPADRDAGMSWPRAYAAALLRLAIQLVPEYVVLVLLLGAARAWLSPAMTATVGHAAWLPPLLAAVGTIFVIPTAAEVPILQSLQPFGLGAAGAAALLLTLPTVSLPSLAMLGRVVPMRVLALLGVGTFGFGLVAAGLAALLGF